VDSPFLFFFVEQQEDRKQLLRSQANQLLLDAKMRGSLHNIDRSSPTTELPPSTLCADAETPAAAEVNSAESQARLSNTKSGQPNDFKKNPFTLVKKKQLKQISHKNYLEEEPEQTLEPKRKRIHILVKDIQNCIRLFVKIICKFSICVISVLVDAKSSPSKVAITYAESRKVQFDSPEQGFQYKPKRNVGKCHIPD